MPAPVADPLRPAPADDVRPRPRRRGRPVRSTPPARAAARSPATPAPAGRSRARRCRLERRRPVSCPSSSWPHSAARNASTASSMTVTTWLLAWASAAWYSVRASSRTRNGSPPISSTSDCAIAYPTSSAAVTPKQVSGSRVDVLVGAGERHRRMDGQRNAALLGQRRQHADAVGAGGVRDDRARPHRRGGREARHQVGEFGVRHREQQQLGAAGDLVDRQHRGVGQPASARCRDAWEIALHATTTCSARSSATPSAVPTRPAEMMPTVSRAGRNPSGVSMQTTSQVSRFVRSGPALRVPDGRL